MAGSRPTSTPTSTTEKNIEAGPRTGEADQQKIPGAPLRVSFAKIQEPLEVPDLLALQTASFDWLIGSPEWRATMGRAPAAAASAATMPNASCRIDGTTMTSIAARASGA